MGRWDSWNFGCQALNHIFLKKELFITKHNSYDSHTKKITNKMFNDKTLLLIHVKEIMLPNEVLTQMTSTC